MFVSACGDMAKADEFAEPVMSRFALSLAVYARPLRGVQD